MQIPPYNKKHGLKNPDGPHTLVQLKKKLNATSELVNFDVGWLAREDKPEIIPDEKTFRVQLK